MLKKVFIISSSTAQALPIHQPKISIILHHLSNDLMIPEHGFFADFFVQISHFQNVDPDPVEESLYSGELMPCTCTDNNNCLVLSGLS